MSIAGARRISAYDKPKTRTGSTRKATANDAAGTANFRDHSKWWSKIAEASRTSPAPTATLSQISHWSRSVTTIANILLRKSKNSLVSPATVPPLPATITISGNPMGATSMAERTNALFQSANRSWCRMSSAEKARSPRMPQPKA